MKFTLLDASGEVIETVEALTLDDARDSIADRWEVNYRWKVVVKSDYWDVKLQDEVNRAVHFRLNPIPKPDTDEYF